MPYRALSDIHMGGAPTVHAGELIPDFYLDMSNQELPVNFDGLVETGDAEKVPEKKPAKAKAKAEDAPEGE